MARISSPRSRARFAHAQLPISAAEEVGHLLVGEGDEADRQRVIFQQRRQLDQHRDGRGVVVGAGRAGHRVVVRADDDGARSGLDVAHLAPAALEVLRLRLASRCVRKRRLDVARRRFEVACSVPRRRAPRRGAAAGATARAPRRRAAAAAPACERPGIATMKYASPASAERRARRRSSRKRWSSTRARASARRSGRRRSRCRPTGAPGRRRCRGPRARPPGSEAWVMIAGCSIRLSTPPRLSASVNRLQRSRKRREAARPPLSTAVTMPP